MNNKFCIFNGDIIKLEDVRISPFDRGILYGDGAFDTMSAPGGIPFLFEEHMERLYDGLKLIGISMPHTSDMLHVMINDLIRRNELDGVDSFVRTAVTRGLNKGAMFYPSSEPTIIVTASQVDDNVNEIRENGVRCVISEMPRIAGNPLCSIKSINFLWSIIGMKESYHMGADECIFFNTSGYLAEGSTSNVFVVKDSAVSTPPYRAGILPGITRGYLIQLLRAEGVAVREADISREELMDADGIFLTSSVRGVVPVRSLNEKIYNNEYIKDVQRIYFGSVKKESIR